MTLMSSCCVQFMGALFAACETGDILFFVDPRPESDRCSLHAVLALLSELDVAAIGHWWVVSGLFVRKGNPPRKN